MIAQQVFHIGNFGSLNSEMSARDSRRHDMHVLRSILACHASGADHVGAGSARGSKCST